MIQHQVFTFNPLAENTYVVWDATGEAVVIDPGCSNPMERAILQEFIQNQKLHVVTLLNTHGHIDHVLGNAFVSHTYQVGLQLHATDLPTLRAVKTYASNFGFSDYEEILPDHYLTESEPVRFGESAFEVLFVPGHAPGHVAFVHRAQELCFSGDVLFRGSIGRADMPGGDYNTLLHSIRTQLLLLSDATRVFAGHGPSTTIGVERRSNPYLINGF